MDPDPAVLRNRPLVFVDDLHDPVLSDDDVHHFERVLRVATGDPIVVGDGSGGWRLARFDRRPQPESDVNATDGSRRRVTVGFTPVKGERPEWFVQKLTELGVDEIVPLLTERSVVRWDETRAAKAHERMSKVAREACLQSRRLRLPVIRSLTTFVEGVEGSPGVVLADPEGRAPTPSDQVIFVGPEGGFSDRERSTAPLVALPGHILRAETAAMVAATIACGFRADLISSGSVCKDSGRGVEPDS